MSPTKRSLPSLGDRDVPRGPPTIEEAREALGGRVATRQGSSLGDLARFRDVYQRDVEGVVVCETAETLDVWIGEGRFQRIAVERARLSRASSEHALADVAADARVFDTLREGQPVRFLSRDGAHREGVLAERCRYGALVSFEGRIFAVSFRRLWPLEAEGA